MNHEDKLATDCATSVPTPTVELPVQADSGPTRRDFLQLAGGAALMSLVPPGVRSGAWAAGSDAPEKKEVRIGFIPLTDCSSVVMAAKTEVLASISG